MKLFKSHFKLNQVQNNAAKVPKHQRFSFCHENLEGLLMFWGNYTLLFHTVIKFSRFLKLIDEQFPKKTLNKVQKLLKWPQRSPKSIIFAQFGYFWQFCWHFYISLSIFYHRILKIALKNANPITWTRICINIRSRKA